MESFKAFQVFDDNGVVQGRVVDATLDELSAGDVVIRAAYSSVNYKDALAAAGINRIIRRYPLVGGSMSARQSAARPVRAGDQFIVRLRLGVSHDEGTRATSAFRRLDSAAAQGMSCAGEVYGTAGSPRRGRDEDRRNGSGPAPVRWRSPRGGGVRSLALHLSTLGYKVTAITGNDHGTSTCVAGAREACRGTR